MRGQPKRFDGDAPTHPGAVLREIAFPAIEMSKSEIARLLGVSRQHLYEVLDEKRPVSPAFAVRLGKFLGNGPELWTRMQAAHDTWHAVREIDVSKIPTVKAA